MTTQKEKQGDTSTHKEKLHSPKNVPCSICLDAVESTGDRSIARLKCGHHFHLDCIGSAFNAKGAMQCPNCRQVEGGQWLFSTGGCYLQQLLRNSSSDQDSNDYAGIHLNMLYHYDEQLSHPSSRRPPHAAYRELPMESDFPSSTNRRRADLMPWNGRLNELARPVASDLDPLHAAGTYIHSSQTINMHRVPLHGSVLPYSHMLEGPIARQRMDEDELVYRREPANGYASSHRYVTNRGAGEREREVAFNLQVHPELRLHGNVGSIEQPSASRFQDARYGQQVSDAFNTRWAGAYPLRTSSGHEWGNSHEAVRRALANPYSGEVHHLHSLNRAASSHSYYDGHQLGARVPWL